MHVRRKPPRHLPSHTFLPISTPLPPWLLITTFQQQGLSLPSARWFWEGFIPKFVSVSHGAATVEVAAMSNTYWWLPSAACRIHHSLLLTGRTAPSSKKVSLHYCFRKAARADVVEVYSVDAGLWVRVAHQRLLIVACLKRCASTPASIGKHLLLLLALLCLFYIVLTLLKWLQYPIVLDDLLKAVRHTLHSFSAKARTAVNRQSESIPSNNVRLVLTSSKRMRSKLSCDDLHVAVDRSLSAKGRTASHTTNTSR